MTLVTLLAAAGCAVQYTYTQHWPQPDLQVCEQTLFSEMGPSPSPAMQMGSAVGLAAYGSSVSDQTTSRAVVGGAPGSSDDPGFVHLVSASIYDGLVDPVGIAQTLTPPASTFQFGSAVAMTDVRNCYGSGPGPADTACGQELIVGAPDDGTGSTPGRVFWYEAFPTANTLYQYGGEVVVGAPLGSEFGAAIEAPASAGLPNEPWEVAPDVAPWVAIGAPGADRVYVLAVDANLFQPLASVATVLHAPGSGTGKDFGSVLQSGDFDGDGHIDLAVGAPSASGGNPDGFVAVHWGDGSAGVFSGVTMLTGGSLWPSPMFPVEHRFGHSMASGSLTYDHPADTLVVGAPRADDGTGEQGAICWWSFESDRSVATSTCGWNPYRAVWGAGDHHFGTSMVAGNHSNVDGVGDEGTPEAALDELAVGTPDRGFGRVEVFLGSGAGPDLNTYVAKHEDSSLGSSSFGSALGVGYVQERAWADLVLGAASFAPGATEDGWVGLSKAVDQSGTCSTPTISGVWEVEDADGTTAQVKIWTDAVSGNTMLLFMDEVDLLFLEDGGTGDACTVTFDDEDEDGNEVEVTEDSTGIIAEGTLVALPGAWVCGATTHTWIDAPMGPVVSTIVYDSIDEDKLQEALGDLGPAAVDLWVSTQKSDVTIDLDHAAMEIEIDLDLDKLGWTSIALWMDGNECRPEPACISGTTFCGPNIEEGVCE
ncbi:MAG: hypothetical protein GY871_02010 [Actinomycetales bacterium]|nr:hypothetical protein [Actinomycetales bacterium]